MTDRLPPFDAAHATPEQKAVLDEILSGPRGNLNGPFLGWIHSPELAQHAQRLGAFCRYDTGLPLRLSELAILVTAARWQAQAEWYIHYPIARDAGVPEALAEAIRTGRQPTFDDDDDALIHAFYDRQIPADVCQTATLEAWYKGLGREEANRLNLSRDELMRHDAAGVTTEVFPRRLA